MKEPEGETPSGNGPRSYGQMRLRREVVSDSVHFAYQPVGRRHSFQPVLLIEPAQFFQPVETRPIQPDIPLFDVLFIGLRLPVKTMIRAVIATDFCLGCLVMYPAKRPLRIKMATRSGIINAAFAVDRKQHFNIRKIQVITDFIQFRNRGYGEFIDMKDFTARRRIAGKTRRLRFSCSQGNRRSFGKTSGW